MGTKSLQTAQYGLYGRDGRFAVVVDLVDAEWTRHAPPFAFEFPRRTRVPRRGAGGSRPPIPKTKKTRDVPRSAEPIHELARRDDLE
jgi:hypothetical protein